MDKKDSIYGISYFVYTILITIIYSRLFVVPDMFSNLEGRFYAKVLYRTLFGLPINLLYVVPIFIILKIRKQGLRSVGIKKDKILKSIIIGTIAAMPMSIYTMAKMNYSIKVINPNILENIITFVELLIFVSFIEELMFRGFLQTRIQGLIKNKWLSMIVVGLIFSIFHIPAQRAYLEMSLTDFIIYNLLYLGPLVLSHIYYTALYTIDKSILAPVIAHTITNFVNELFILPK
ncbi:CPBP family intramembrane glutamic endopeptidase [Dethiothermospora halolimnae]|uniref:CPBP family intramembrane glutamic endopeptidase n=1 Tax=Dethiothermospora halolimnae TaxID=3114390 RepID=UPI003CCB85D5